MGFNSNGGRFGDSGISHYQKKESSDLKPGSTIYAHQGSFGSLFCIPTAQTSTEANPFVLSLSKHAFFPSDITEFALRKSIVRALKIFHGMGLNWKI